MLGRHRICSQILCLDTFETCEGSRITSLVFHNETIQTNKRTKNNIPFLTTEIKQTSTFCLNSLTELLLKPKLYPIIVLADPHSSTDSTWPHSYFPGLEIQYNKLKYRSKSQILNCKFKKSSLYPESSKRLTKYQGICDGISQVFFFFN